MAAKWQWIALAFLFAWIEILSVFEGLAVLQLCKAFGYKEKVKRGIVYSAVDIYFSAIYSVSYRRSAGIGNVL
ncbi:MAG: hypothetical protein ACLRR3_04230 [Eubacterium sp.]